MDEDELVTQIRTRAGSDARTDHPPTMFGETVSSGHLTIVGVPIFGGDPERPPLAEPCDREALNRAETVLGQRLPPLLARLYLEVADGGFGPGSGLMRVADAVAAHQELRAFAPGPGGEVWPANLLPLIVHDPGYLCCDLDSGEIVDWDEERLLDEPWDASFCPQSPDIASWFADWVNSESPRELHTKMIDEGLRETLRASLGYWRGVSPAERAAAGLPEVGWEQELFGHLGIDLSEL